jgi:hypothetical protein
VADLTLSAVLTASSEQFNAGVAAAASAATSAFEQIRSAFSDGAAATTSAMSQATESTSQWRDALDELASTAAGVAGGIAIVDVAEKAGSALREAVLGTAEWSEGLRNMAATIGVTTNELQLLQGAGELSGVSMDRLQQFAIQLQRRLGETGASSRQLQAALAVLGVSGGDFGDLNSALLKISASINRLGGDTPQVREALAQLGSRGSQGLEPLLQNLSALEARFAGLGAVISSEGVAKASAFGAALNQLKVVTETVGRDMGVSFAGVGAAMANSLSSLITVGVGAVEQVNAAISGVLREIIDFAVTAGRVVEDSLTGHWGAIQGDWSSGMAKVTSDWSGALTRMKSDAIGTWDTLKAVWATPIEAPTAVQGPAGPLPGTATKQAGAAGAQTGQGSASESAAQMKAALDQQFQDFVSEQRLEAAEAGSTAASKITEYQRVYAEAVSLFGAQSIAARQAAVDEIAAEKSYTTQQTALTAEADRNAAASAVSGLNAQKDALAQQVAAHQISRSQELADEQGFVAQEQAIDDAMYTQRLVLYSNDAREFERTAQEKIAADQKFQQQIQADSTQATDAQMSDQQRLASGMATTMSQIEGAFQKGQSVMQNLAKIGFDDMLQLFNGLLSSMLAAALTQLPVIGQLFQTAMGQMSGGGGGGGFGGIGSSIGNSLVSGIESLFGGGGGAGGLGSMLGPLSSIFAGGGGGAMAGGAGGILSLFAGGGGGGIGDMLAELGPLAFMAFPGGGEVPIAAGGADILSRGGMGGHMPAMLRAREMVLNPQLADHVRDSFANRDSGNAGVGDVHVHYNGDFSAIDGQGIKDLLSEHADHIAEAVMDKMGPGGQRFRRSVG